MVHFLRLGLGIVLLRRKRQELSKNLSPNHYLEKNLKKIIFYYDRFSHLYIIDDSLKLRERFVFLLPFSILLFALKLLKSVDNDKRASVLAPLSYKCEILIDSD